MKIVHSASIEKTSLALPLTTEVALNDPDDYDNNIFEEKNKSVKWAMPQLKKKEHATQSGAPIQAKSNRKFARFFFSTADNWKYVWWTLDFLQFSHFSFFLW